MKRKEYIQPEVQVIDMEVSNIVAASPNIDLGGPATDEEAGAAAYRNNLWDN